MVCWLCKGGVYYVLGSSLCSGGRLCSSRCGGCLLEAFKQHDSVLVVFCNVLSIWREFIVGFAKNRTVGFRNSQSTRVQKYVNRTYNS